MAPFLLKLSLKFVCFILLRVLHTAVISYLNTSILSVLSTAPHVVGNQKYNSSHKDWCKKVIRLTKYCAEGYWWWPKEGLDQV